MANMTMSAALKDMYGSQTMATTHPENNSYGQLHGREAIRDYVFGGNATFTLVSKNTGRRFTYRVKSAPKDRSQNWSTNNQNRDFYFVSVLTGGDNNSSYTYIGQLTRAKSSDPMFRFQLGRKAPAWAHNHPPSVEGFFWFIKKLGRFEDFESKLEFWHEGHCGRCGRKLTVPSSIESGMGPECAGKES